MSGTMANPAPTWGDPTLTDAEKAALAALCARKSRPAQSSTFPAPMTR